MCICATLRLQELRTQHLPPLKMCLRMKSDFKWETNNSHKTCLLFLSRILHTSLLHWYVQLGCPTLIYPHSTPFCNVYYHINKLQELFLSCSNYTDDENKVISSLWSDFDLRWKLIRKNNLIAHMSIVANTEIQWIKCHIHLSTLWHFFKFPQVKVLYLWHYCAEEVDIKAVKTCINDWQ